jgi:hypothetical protein
VFQAPPHIGEQAVNLFMTVWHDGSSKVIRVSEIIGGSMTYVKGFKIIGSEKTIQA